MAPTTGPFTPKRARLSLKIEYDLEQSKVAKSGKMDWAIPRILIALWAPR